MKKNIYDYVNILTDIICVIIIQVLIVFLLIVIPSIIHLLRTVGAQGNATLVFQSMSVNTAREIIESSKLVQILKIVGGCVGTCLAPLIYENTGKSKQKSKDNMVKRYLKGFRIDVKVFLQGACLAIAMLGIVVVYNCAMKQNCKMEMDVWSVVSIVLFALCREMLCRYYVLLKTEGYGKILFIALSNILFVFAECMNLVDVTAFFVVAISIESILMTIWVLKDKNISRTFAFRCVFSVVSYIIFNTHMPESSIVIVVLIIFLVIELTRMIKGNRFDEKVY